MINEDPIPWPSPETRSAIIRTVQRWNRLQDVGAGQHADQNIKPSTAETAGAEPPPRARDEQELRTAAQRAQLLYPGAAGELIHRELLAVADFGYGPTSGQSLLIRLTDQILADPTPITPNDGSRAFCCYEDPFRRP